MKVFNDPIHGHIELTSTEISVIDTPQFQRLRELKQMGISYYVFTGATHCRFEHSIGVCHMAGKYCEILQKSQPDLNISANDVKCVRLAGLCHDLGHGPFSHLFDSLVIPLLQPHQVWSHEQASEEMLEYLIQDNPQVDISESELTFIRDLIHGEARSRYPQAQKKYLFEIVSNKRNSIDVDKFDYILRDCHNIGIRHCLDPIRLMTFSRIIDNQICFHQKEAFNLYQQVYTHKVSTALEFMVRDILVSADSFFHIKAQIHDMSQYVNLNDSILTIIERSTDPQLKTARKLLRRIRTRDLYQCADSVIVPHELFAQVSECDITPAIILKACDYTDICEDDIIVQWLTLSYCMKDKNPIDSVSFYTKYDNKTKVSAYNKMILRKEHVSGLVPETFKELTVRVYSRQPHLLARIQFGFRNVLENINDGLVQYGHSLEADSFLEYPETSRLAQLARKLEDQPIADAQENPFLDSPQKKAPPSINSVPSSPIKRLLEPNQGLSIPGSFQKSLKKLRKNPSNIDTQVFINSSD